MTDLSESQRAELLDEVGRAVVAITTNADEAETLRARRAEVVRQAIDAGVTPTEIAGRLGITPERVRQWHREARSEATT